MLKSGTWHLSCLFYLSLLPIWCRASFYRRCCRTTIIALLAEVSSRRKKVNPAVVISDVHKKTSAPDCPSFCSQPLHPFSMGRTHPCCYSPINHEQRWLKICHAYNCLSSVMRSACLVTTKQVNKEQPSYRNLSATATRVLQCTYPVAASRKYFSAIHTLTHLTSTHLTPDYVNTIILHLVSVLYTAVNVWNKN